MDICPIDSLDALWKWENRTDVDHEYTEKLVNFKPRSGPQVLVCHDMKGGYLEEEMNGGKQFEEGKYPYMMLNWWQIDIFNYFSHHFVTIPPAEYTRISHQHGVLSLGTFITEWIPGKEICAMILESEESVEKTVNCLVAVANHFGFDGWLINIENEIDEKKIELLLRFCSSLTKKSRESNENSRVIWYDSVLHNGKLHWQNALNAENCRFYDACDAIYLNYNWTDGDLFRSAEFGRLDRIFVGIDVWARGCVGEFHCHESFALAKLFHISVALFAPGWIYEKFPDENQIVMGIRFWEKLKPHIRTRPLTSANFSTNFCSGMEENWRFRLSSLELQPQHLSAFCHPIVGKGVVLFGGNRIFPLFTFDSIPCGEIEIICESDNAINVLWNHNEIAGKTGEHTWIISQSGTIESIKIQTANHDKTVIRRFSVSCFNSKS
ncbi:unnamed protein product [Caenorhabditis sp. 36 PRJEB53466]|nr:unnamed protein product [Caenorhabditis sp. 36 PRJEB53466]